MRTLLALLTFTLCALPAPGFAADVGAALAGMSPAGECRYLCALRDDYERASALRDSAIDQMNRNLSHRNLGIATAATNNAVGRLNDVLDASTIIKARRGVLSKCAQRCVEGL